MEAQLPTMLGSATAGIIGRVICFPLDTIKARLQASQQSSTSLLSIIRPKGSIYTHIRGFYRGLGVSVLGSAPATCLYLTSYEVSKDWFESTALLSNHPAQVYFWAGMAAEAISCVFWVPIDVIKERMQIQAYPSVVSNTKSLNHTFYRNTWDAIRVIMATEGIQGIYKGYYATLFSFGPFSGLYFLFYEKTKEMARNYSKSEELSPSYTLASSALAGSMASILTNPLDLVKLRLQVQRTYVSESSDIRYKGIADALGTIVKNEGFFGLFKGAGARVAFHAPSTAITMSIFESCRNGFEKILNND